MTEKKAESHTIAEFKNEQFSKEERAHLKLICKGEELQEDERLIDQVVVLDGEKEKSEQGNWERAAAFSSYFFLSPFYYTLHMEESVV